MYGSRTGLLPPAAGWEIVRRAMGVTGSACELHRPESSPWEQANISYLPDCFESRSPTKATSSASVRVKIWLALSAI